MGQIYFPGQPGKIILPPSGGAPIINYIGSNDTPGSQYAAGYSIGLHHSDYLYTAVSGDTVVEIGIYAKRISSPDKSVDVGIYTLSGGGLYQRQFYSTITGIGSTAAWYTASVSWSLSAGTQYAVAFQNASSAGIYVYFTNVDAAKRSDWDSATSLPATWSRALTDRARFEVYAKVQR